MNQTKSSTIGRANKDRCMHQNHGGLEFFRKSRRAWLADKFNSQPGWLRAILFPVLNSTSVLVCSIAAKYESIAIAVPAFIFFLLFTIASSLISHLNAEELEAVRRQRNTVLARLSAIDKCVRMKCIALARVFSAIGSDQPIKLLRASRFAVDFDNSIYQINELLLLSVRAYLEEKGRLNGANVFLAVLIPNEDGYFSVAGETHSTGGPRKISGVTKVKFDDEKTMAGKLWAAEESRVMCAASTKEAESAGEFTFYSEQEKGLIKSIFTYRVDHPVLDDATHGKKFGVWSLDSDLEHVFPSRNERDVIEGLLEVFSSFEERIKLELTYKAMFSSFDHIIEKAIDETGSSIDKREVNRS